MATKRTAAATRIKKVSTSKKTVPIESNQGVVVVQLERMEKLNSASQKIIDAHLKTSGKSLNGFVLKFGGRAGGIGTASMCKCQCSSTLDCGGGGGGGG